MRCLFLQRFAVIGTEGIIAEELFQVVMNVEHAVAILAAIGALSMAEHIDDMFYFGVMAEYPTWGNRLVVVCAYEGQGVCQAARRLGCKSRNVGMGANMILVFRKNEF